MFEVGTRVHRHMHRDEKALSESQLHMRRSGIIREENIGQPLPFVIQFEHGVLWVQLLQRTSIDLFGVSFSCCGENG